MKSILTAAAVLAIGFAAPNAYAIGCLSGGAVGAVGGHMAGHHGVLGAAAGCAVGHHVAVKNRRAALAAQQNQQVQPQ